MNLRSHLTTIELALVLKRGQGGQISLANVNPHHLLESHSSLSPQRGWDSCPISLNRRTIACKDLPGANESAGARGLLNQSHIRWRVDTVLPYFTHILLAY
jgi:hypothetical protein